MKQTRKNEVETMTENPKNADKPPRFCKGGPPGPGRPRGKKRPLRFGESGYEEELLRRADQVSKELALLIARYPERYSRECFDE